MYKKFLIYGLGNSGIAAAKYLISLGYEVFLTDDNDLSLQNARQKMPQNAAILDSDSAMQKIDAKTAVVFAPGIPLYYPKKHKILETGANLICDIELFYLLNEGANFIGITGTNGKSTSSALIDFILNKIGIGSKLAGNIGVAVFELMKSGVLKDDNFVLETSSYQLDLMKKTRFNVAALTNISVDHIDRHGNFDNYVLAKKNIFNNQNESDYAVLNIDNEASLQILNNANLKAKIIPFSCQKNVENGVAIINSVLHNKIDGENFSFDLKDAFLRGLHNMENIALAFCCVYALLKIKGLASEEMQKRIIAAIVEFKGLRHRMQIVGEINNVKFINDSKATNAESTQKAMSAYDDLFIILGGKAKEGGISSLEPYFKKIVKAYLIGDATDEFALTLQEKVNFVKCGTLENAVKMAYEDALNFNGKEKNILLSPACASFDQWKNFEERGDYFCKLFDEIKMA
jgi:UDP-N-acetylmuramoylalanine--D-glutamate ligase